MVIWSLALYRRWRKVHPYMVEQVAEARVTELIDEAESARVAARVAARRRPRRRGLGIARRITRRVDRRRLRDLAF